ncbi:MAG: ABC transporter substrate-binding protein [Spirochaetota bacterium]
MTTRAIFRLMSVLFVSLFLMLSMPVFSAGEAEGSSESASESGEVDLLGYGIPYQFAGDEPHMPGYYYWPEFAPHINIEADDASVSSVLDLVVERIPAGVWPDFYFLTARDVPRALALGHIAPLDDFQESHPEVFDRFTESALDLYSIDGVPYALPYTVKPHGLYLNTDVFEAQGVDIPDEDWTWPELVELAVELTDKPDYIGWELGPNAWYVLYSMLVSYDADIYVEEDGRRVSNLADDDKAIEAIELFLDLHHNLGIQYTAEETEEFGIGNAFNEGRLAMRFAGTWTQTWGSWNAGEGEYRFNTEVLRVPTGPGGRGVFPDGYGVALHPAGNREAAFEAVSHVTSEQWGDFAIEVAQDNDEIDLATIWNLYYEDDPRMRDGMPPWRGADERDVHPAMESDYRGFLETTQDFYTFDFDFGTYFEDEDFGLGQYMVAVAEGEMDLVGALREFDEWATRNVLND